MGEANKFILLARAALKNKADDREAATLELVETFRADHDLLAEFVDDHLPRMCRDLLHTVSTETRRSVGRAVASEARAESARQQTGAGQRLVNSTATLLDWVLICGTPMARADQKKLHASALHYKKQGRTMTGHGNWLASVANKLPKGKLVGQHFNARELKHIWDATHD